MALKEAHKLLTSPSEGARPDAKKILLLITDKKSDSSPKQLREAAQPLERDDIRVIPVAVGDQANPTELAHITPSKDNVITPGNDETSVKIAEEVMKKALRGKKGVILQPSSQL